MSSPAAWNDTFDESTDWSHRDFLRMFDRAQWERYSSSPGSAEPSTYVPWPNQGDDVQIVLGAIPGDHAAINQWQLNVAGSIGSYVDPEFDLAGVIPSYPFPTFPSDAYYTTDTIFAAIGNSTGAFTRKRPREIAQAGYAVTTLGVPIPASTTDTSGNTLADGMIARLVTPTTPKPAGDGLVYQRAAGVWLTYTDNPVGAVPDLLSSLTAAPNHVAGGTMQEGDYIGPWIFTELRDLINLMVKQMVRVTFDGQQYHFLGFGFGSSPAAAEAAAEANYQFIGTEFGADRTELAYAGTNDPSDPPNAYSAQIESLQGYAVVEPAIPIFLMRAIDVYLVGDYPNNDDTLNFAPGAYNLALRSYTLFQTVGPDSASRSVSVPIGPNITPPPTTSGTPGTRVVPWPAADDTANGVDVLATEESVALIRWDVAGGFQYTSGT